MTGAGGFDAAVAIVGAGPVGLSAALKFASLGIGCTLLEAEENPAADLRASTFHPPTLEMLDTIGLAEPLLARGLVTPDWQIRVHETGERAFFDLSLLSEDTPYPFRLQCEQSVLCALAMTTAEGEALVELRRRFRVVALDQDDNGVTLRSSDGEAIRSRWVVGADGARSTVREAAGFAFEGFTYPETTILATTAFPFHDHIAGLSNVNYCWSDHGTFSLLRLPKVWRCSLYADPGESTEDAAEPASIEKKLQRIVTRDGGHDIIEVRPYRIHQRIVETYRRGRVMLAGDAAHLNSPSGGMGMNGGIHDAFALCEALAAVLQGGDEAVLDRYSRSRKAVAEEQILAQAHRNRTRMQERDPAERRAELKRLQRICGDPQECRAYLLKSSMIEGLRQAQAVA